MSMQLPSFYDDLDETLAQCWQLWSRGVADRRSPFHSPMAASVGLDGRPRARVVILRACEPAAFALRFHTDRRSAKFSELAADPRIALTGYDHAAKIQIRAEGRAVLHTEDDVADAAWAGSRPFSQVCYGVTPGPGVELTAGGAFILPSDEADIADGRANFCAVRITLESFEWLYLAHAGHRRAHFTFRSGKVEKTWISP